MPRPLSEILKVIDGKIDMWSDNPDGTHVILEAGAWLTQVPNWMPMGAAETDEDAEYKVSTII